MAFNSGENVEQALLDLLGEETYSAFFTDVNGESDHTPGDVHYQTANRDAVDVGELVPVTSGGGAGNDWDMDSVCMEAIAQFEASHPLNTYEAKISGERRFAAPKSEKDVEQARKARIPRKTQTDTKYCVEIWKTWSIYRNSVVKNEQVYEDITSLDSNSLQYWMSRFVLEVRKKDGTEYPPNTLHHICCGILRHLRENGQPGIDIFKDSSFSDFRSTLDGEMKRLQSLGIGVKKRQAEPLTEEEEEKLWTTGQLGDHSPQALLDTMIFMHGIYFALRSGQEHRNLRFSPAQVEVVARPGERAFLRYTEDISKNNPGGLKGRKQKPKIGVQHENLENPTRCFVRLFRLYQSKCPPSRPKDAFYLKPLKNPTEQCWYTSRAIGHHTLDNTVSRMCKSAGIEGFKTNHSLRVTTATRLFQAGVDEQLIMEKTGHHSTDGIRTYKRSSTEQQEAISDILSRSKKPKMDMAGPQNAMVCGSRSLITQDLDVTNPSVSSEPQSSSIIHSNKQLVIHPDNVQRMFTFNSCSGVNINVQIH